MTDVTTTARETRPLHVVEAQRAAARERLDSPQRFEQVQARGVLAAVAWLLDGGPAPITGGVVEPTERAISRERLRAEDAEALALDRGLTEQAWWTGTVGVVLSWYHCRTHTEAPY